MCHISYLTSSLSNPTPTFRTYFQPLLRRYLNSTSCYPFVAMQPPLLFSPFLLPSIIPCSPIVLYCHYFRLYLQYLPVIILIIYVLVSCYDPLFPSHI